ncbi:phosphoglycerate kinase [Maritalea sp.]|uniref:phosphoglycerate kinase n=1 Tax=Maritalea sp. TaxID=2003361 RepID=UPI003EF432B5
MSDFKKLEDFDFNGKRVLVRVDLNVPVADGKVTDNTRIVRLGPTMSHIIEHGGTPVLLSHFGRPKGKVNPEFSLRFIVNTIKNAFGQPVEFVETDWSDVSAAKSKLDAGAKGTIYVMENTRFHPGEEANDDELATRMASLGDIYLNDAFSAAHRAHASTAAIAHKLPSGAGRAMETELSALQKGLGQPQKPVIAIVGGAKVSTKIDLLENLVTKVEALVIGGGMANTFLHAQGIDIGKSLCEKDLAETARRIYDKAADANCAIILPIDGVVAWHFEAGAPNRTYGVEAMDQTGMMLDVGDRSIERIKGAIDEAKTLIWNGPLGAFELDPFGKGTIAIAHYAAKRTNDGKLVSVAGGGDTVAALAKAKVVNDFSYVSTAGGAFLEWMEGKPLPGVEALKN